MYANTILKFNICAFSNLLIDVPAFSLNIKLFCDSECDKDFYRMSFESTTQSG